MVVLLKGRVVVVEEVDVEVCVLVGEVLLPRASAMVSEATIPASELVLTGASEALLASVGTEGSDGDKVGDTSTVVASTPGVTVIVVVMVVTSVTLVVVVVVVAYCSKDGLSSKWAC